MLCTTPQSRAVLALTQRMKIIRAICGVATKHKPHAEGSPRCATAAAVPAKFGATYSGAKGSGTVLPQPIFSSLSCRIAPFSSSFAACACARVCTNDWQRCHISNAKRERGLSGRQAESDLLLASSPC